MSAPAFPRTLDEVNMMFHIDRERGIVLAVSKEGADKFKPNVPTPIGRKDDGTTEMFTPKVVRVMTEKEFNSFREGMKNYLGRFPTPGKEQEKKDAKVPQATDAVRSAKAAEYQKSADARAASAAAHGAKAADHRAKAETHRANLVQIAKFREMLLAAQSQASPPSLTAKGSQASVIPTSVVSAHSVASQSLVSAADVRATSAADHGAKADAYSASAAAHGAKAEALKAEAAVHKANAAKIAEYRALLLASKAAPSLTPESDSS